MFPEVKSSPFVRLVWTALLVCAGCFLGATFGVRLRFPQSGAAIFFAPYAILTTALLRSPPRIWWVYFLAAAAGDFVPHRLSGAPISFVLLAEVANVTRAVVATWGVRRFGDSEGRLGTLKDMAVFLFFATFFAPGVAAFIGAGVAIHHGAENYGLAWRSWFLSNTLTGLTLLPILLLGVDELRAPLRRPSVLRVVEAAVLSVALFWVGHSVLEPNALSATLPAALYAPLPLLLWAAVRFGRRGTCATLLIVAFQAIDGALDGRGPFATRSPADNLFHLQLFLFVISVPLLLLSALVQEQRRTAEALRASQRQYRAVVEDQTELVCRFRPDGTLTFVNGAFARSATRLANELVGTSFWALLPAERRDEGQRLIDALDASCPVATWEHAVENGGDARWEQWRVRALFDDRGRVVDYQGVGRDITERKRAEEGRRLLEAEQALALALREADRRKDEFLAMLAHELRNPLAPISMVVEILRVKQPADEQVRWARDVLDRQVSQMKRLVDDLLDVSRITSGKIQVRIDSVDLASVIANAVETSRPLLLTRNIALDIDVPAVPLLVRGDAARLAQLVSNLLNNAAKYTDVGDRIVLRAAREGAHVVLRCVDTGVGIPEHMLDRVFEPFTQVDRSRDGALGGLGLGLTLVKRLAEMHGGSVEARSEGPGRGSEFVVRLVPWREVTERAGAADAPTMADEAPPSSARKVLVVDDAVDAAESLAMLITLHGHTVHVAHDGPSALDAALRLGPEIVFLDLTLPKMDGLEVARRLRSRFARRVVLVATTGFGQSDDRRRTTEAGFDHHLVKPIDPSKVQALLASFVTA
jgi:PAS domain S-box-containing protein